MYESPFRTKTTVALLDEVHEILDPGVDRIEDGKHPDIGDAMNPLGRVVAAFEHLAKEIDKCAVMVRSADSRFPGGLWTALAPVIVAPALDGGQVESVAP
jgi:hypothetical protein